MLSSVFRSSRVRLFAVRTYASKIKYNEESPNYAILEMLNSNMQDEVEGPSRNPYKVRAFETAIKSIAKLDYQIQSNGDAERLKGVGAGIARRINEFLLERAKSLGPESLPKAESSAAAIQRLERQRLKRRLMEIPGIGETKASRLLEAGCSSVEDLRDPRYQELLTKAQRIGADFFSHTQQPVARHEAEAVAHFIRDNISSKFEVHIVGSYRRGAKTSSDIDIILLHPSHVHVPTPSIPPSAIQTTIASTSDAETHSFAPKKKARGKASSKLAASKSPLLPDVVEPLYSRGLLAATISAGPHKWQGITLVPDSADDSNDTGEVDNRQERLRRIANREGVYRRIDLNMVPMKTRGAAFLALTGDAEFNRHARATAVRHGLHLNEYGLWRWCADSNGTPKSADKAITREEAYEALVEAELPRGHWELLRAETEEEIIRTLGMEYVEPEKRNFEYIAAREKKPVKAKATGGGRPRKNAQAESV
ncbi:hypothetical protein HGRIS_005809 [Hohenbuehelia grisea]|uniref:DNA polymerase n=1 Tax=Hohenbuehelia grisea TaxID=104357 RepID=A0ABR3JZV4_9AGAR